MSLNNHQGLPETEAGNYCENYRNSNYTGRDVQFKEKLTKGDRKYMFSFLFGERALRNVGSSET